MTAIDDISLNAIVDKLSNEDIEVNADIIRYIQLFQSTISAEAFKKGESFRFHKFMSINVSTKNIDRHDFINSIKHLDVDTRNQLMRERGILINKKVIKPSYNQESLNSLISSRYGSQSRNKV